MNAPDPAVTALARSVDRATRAAEKDRQQLTDLAATVSEMAPVLADLAEKVAALKPKKADAAKPVSWLLTTEPGRAQEALTDLAEWLQTVYLLYPGASLPPCWAFHPDVVEELLALRQTHHDAYQGERASGVAAVDWHAKHRPGVAGRIAAAHSTCGLSQHQPGGKAAKPTPGVPLAAHTHVVAGHWAVQHDMPEPSQQQLNEAQQIQETRLHGSRR